MRLHENKLNQFLKQIKKMPNPEAVVLSLMQGFVICRGLPLITLPQEKCLKVEHTFLVLFGLKGQPPPDCEIEEQSGRLERDTKLTLLTFAAWGFFNLSLILT